MSEDKQYPSLVQQGKNLAKFSWDLIKYLQSENNYTTLFVDDEVYKERIMTCRACDKHDELENRCTECGCFIPPKAKMILDSCPLGKWKEDQQGWEEKFGGIMNSMNNEPPTGLDNTP